MHFSIPDTETIRTQNSSYISYIIYVNGIPYSSIRYKKLREFYEQLKQSHPNILKNVLFPSKNIFMSDFEIEERREALEKFLQSITIFPEILLDTYFIQSMIQEHIKFNQKNIFKPVTTSNLFPNNSISTIKIFLSPLTDDLIELHILLFASTLEIIEKLCHTLSIPLKYIPSLTLSIIKECSYGGTNISKQNIMLEKCDSFFVYMTRLNHFECPVLTKKALEQCYNDTECSVQFLLGIRFWDKHITSELLNDPVTSKLVLYHFVNHEILSLKDVKYILSLSPVHSDYTSYISNIQTFLDKEAFANFLTINTNHTLHNNMNPYLTLENTGKTVLISKLMIGMDGIVIVPEKGKKHNLNAANGHINGNDDIKKIQDIMFFKTSRIKNWRITSYHKQDVIDSNNEKNSYIPCAFSTNVILCNKPSTSQYESLNLSDESVTTFNISYRKHYCSQRLAYKFSFQYLWPKTDAFEWILIEHLEFPLFINSCLHEIVHDLIENNQGYEKWHTPLNISNGETCVTKHDISQIYEPSPKIKNIQNGTLTSQKSNRPKMSFLSFPAKRCEKLPFVEYIQLSSK